MADAIPDHFGYKALIPVFEVYADTLPVIAAVKNPKIRTVSEHFNANLFRLFSLFLHTPAFLVSAHSSQRLTTRTNIDVCGQAVITVEEIEKRGLRDAWQKRFREIDQSDPKQTDGELFEDGMLALQKIIHNTPPNSNIHVGVAAIISSILTGAWTAFEALAGDLWAEAVNVRPKSLGRKAVDAQVSDDDDADAAQSGEANRGGGQKTGRNKAIGAERFRQLSMQHGFDLGGIIGDVVRRERRAAFNRLDGLRAYYRVTFGKPAEDLIDSEPNLLALEAIRNVLVHQGGRVDGFFHERVEKFPELHAIEVGKYLPINGILVSQYATPAIHCGRKLIAFVDQWLADNPD